MGVLSLFSGIGGFDLGLERAGMRPLAFCEADPFCRSILAKHWPEIPIYDDIRTLTSARLRADGIAAADLICGGFPCQDVSTAGPGGGLDGSRSGLWWEMHRLISEERPRWALIENSPALRRRGMGALLGALAAIGYDAEWHCVPASAVGAPHDRDRIWIVAYPSQQGLEVTIAGAQGELAAALRAFSWPTEPPLPRVVYGLSGRVDRVKALGASVVPALVEAIGRAVLHADIGIRP